MKQGDRELILKPRADLGRGFLDLVGNLGSGDESRAAHRWDRTLQEMEGCYRSQQKVLGWSCHVAPKDGMSQGCGMEPVLLSRRAVASRIGDNLTLCHCHLR